ncbi:MAG: hypothetical protein ACOYK5_10000 [Bacteroidia bacterium]|jgi:hypothetical protein
MKTLLVWLAFALGGLAWGQTLQFSQVLLVSSNTQTVPAGKVWKVENILASSSLVASGNQTVNFSITVDNTQVFVAGANSQVNVYNQGVQSMSSTSNQLVQPIWLPAGSTLAAGQNVFRVSVIEFTVLP